MARNELGGGATGGAPHPTRRAVVARLALAAAPVGRRAMAAADSGSSDWSGTGHARVRLIDAGPRESGGATRLVGIEVALDPGYLTYWRSPGEAGVPPTVGFAGSTGLKAATLLFPAPGRYSEDGTEAIGYKDSVVFPLVVVPAAAGLPVGLKLAMDFALCERQCLPAKAACSLLLDGSGTTPGAGLVRDALARVPVAMTLGQDGPLAIVAVAGTAADATLTVEARASASDVPLLFAEAPDPWFVQAGEGLWTSDGTLRYTLKVVGRPADPAALALRLTLVGTDAAIEVPVTLDAPPATP